MNKEQLTKLVKEISEENKKMVKIYEYDGKKIILPNPKLIKEMV